MNSMQKYELWVRKAKEPTVAKLLKEMANDTATIENCFYQDLKFGTAGLRGKMNAGTNCLNYYTVVQVTQGVAQYMLAQGMKSVAIAYDSRNNSEYFSHTIARVLATNGIVAYIAESCMPTPFLSFAVRELHCDMGINITASHNPKEYNGYKVYNADGCQLTDNAANEVTRYIETVDAFDVEVADGKQLFDKNLIRYFPADLADRYLKCVLQQSLCRADSVKVAYSPLNGTGYIMVPQVLEEVGAKVQILETQSTPDGNFPTCPKPNPELNETMKAVIDLAKAQNCDIAIATDPDCDRVGVAVKHNGEFVRLSGNEVGIVLTDFILQNLHSQNKLPQNGVLIKSIVTTTLVDKIAASYGVQTINLLTGFKYIGEKIGELEKRGEVDRVVFGFEESCGYLRGSYVRDKDGVVASMLIAEAVAFYQKTGQTAVDRLNELYKEYGLYQHKMLSFRFDGADGEARKNALLQKLRNEGISHLADSEIVETRDLLQPSDLPKSNVLIYKAQDGSMLVVRPSGTEPLVKTYLTVCSDARKNAIKLQQIEDYLKEFFQ